MLIRISEWLYKVSNTWVAISALIVFLLFSTLVLPRQTSQTEEYSGDARSPDLSIFYTPDLLYEMAESYGEQGRNEYVNARFTFDLVWPLIYTFFLTTAISWVFARVFTQQYRILQANLLPIFAMLFDLLENISTSLVMVLYPDEVILIAWVAPIFTSTKWLLVASSILALIAGCAYGIWKWLRVRLHR